MAGLTFAGQTSPWYWPNGHKVLYLNIDLYMIWPYVFEMETLTVYNTYPYCEADILLLL